MVQSGTVVILHLETEELDVAFQRAVEAGATVTEEIFEQAWGARCGKVKDPYLFNLRYVCFVLVWFCVLSRRVLTAIIISISGKLQGSKF